MTIVGKYSFNKGEEVVKEKYLHLLKEIEIVISNVKAEEHKTKSSKEKTMPGRMLYNPKALNKAFAQEFKKFEWIKKKIKCDYSREYYTKEFIDKGITKKQRTKNAYREMDFIKELLGVEVQFGKYSFMVYNVCAKMTIFKKLAHIDTGIEIVPIKQFANEMSTGVSYFEQFIWDLEKRGIADIDIPVLILGIDTEASSKIEKVQDNSLFKLN